MRTEPRKTNAKSPRKIALEKLSVTEILTGLKVTNSELRHARRALDAAMKTEGDKGGLTKRFKKQGLPTAYRPLRKGGKVTK
jgi:hypothetical protein